jgi:hypothetical protein
LPSPSDPFRIANLKSAIEAARLCWLVFCGNSETPLTAVLGRQSKAGRRRDGFGNEFAGVLFSSRWRQFILPASAVKCSSRRTAFKGWTRSSTGRAFGS